MDLATIIGIISGVSLVLWSILMGSPLSAFIDTPSVAIVCGGCLAAVLTSFPLRTVMNLAKVVKKTILTRPPSPTALIQELVRFAEVARRDGILALENVTNEKSDKFLVTGIQMAVDGTDPALVEQMLNSELESLADRHAQGKALLDNLGKYGPAYGMIGTLVGLVIMLQNMDDPAKIGPGMAVALLTTLYGSVISNMFALPLGDKLSLRSAEELMLKSIIIRGIMAIQAGDNPRIVEQKLLTFLPHRLRTSQSQQKSA